MATSRHKRRLTVIEEGFLSMEDFKSLSSSIKSLPGNRRLVIGVIKQGEDNLPWFDGLFKEDSNGNR